MTAIACIALGARGRLMTDTAVYDRDGVMMGTVNKAFTFPHLGMVVTSRGATATRRTLAEEIEGFDTFDAVIAEGAQILREAHEAGAFWLGEENESEFDLSVVGWSTSRRQVEAYSLASVAQEGFAPFVFTQMSVLLGPLPDDEALRRIGLKVGRHFDTSRPTEKLLEVIEMQRQMAGPIGTRPNAATGYVVGGAAVLTEVTEAGITQRVIRRWPDEIGSRIAPEGAPPVPSRSPPHLRIVS